MNDYALNEVPINANATWQGFSSAGLQLAGTGKSATVAQGTILAGMSLATVAYGTRRVMGAGDMTYVIEAAALGTLGTLGVSDALMQFKAEGIGQASYADGSTASMAMYIDEVKAGILVLGEVLAPLGGLQVVAHGVAAHGIPGSCLAALDMRLSGHGEPHRTVRGSGYALGWTYATAQGNQIVHPRALAELGLDVKATARIASLIYGAAGASLTLDMLRAMPDSYRQINGEADIALALVAVTRDQRVVVLPSEFYPAPRSRIMRRSRDNRSMRVPRDRRYMKVG